MGYNSVTDIMGLSLFV